MELTRHRSDQFEVVVVVNDNKAEPFGLRGDDEVYRFAPFEPCAGKRALHLIGTIEVSSGRDLPRERASSPIAHLMYSETVIPAPAARDSRLVLVSSSSRTDRVTVLSGVYYTVLVMYYNRSRSSPPALSWALSNDRVIMASRRVRPRSLPGSASLMAICAHACCSVQKR